MRRRIIIAFTAVSIWGGALADPVLASDPSDCYEAVLVLCADAMEGANWLERFALGVICTGLLAGCAAEELIDIAL